MNTIRTCFLCLPMALPLSSRADSNVQLYGRVDASVNYQKYADTASAPGLAIKTISSDTSFFGFRGTEDLGDGLQAYFKLESGLNADTGQANGATTFFNRESYVGMRSPRYGAVDLGTHWAPTLLLTSRVDPFGRSQLGANESLLQGAAARGYAIQFANSIQYVTPTFFGGLSAKLLLQAPEATLSKNRAGSINYDGERLTAAVTYDDVQITGATVGQTDVASTRSKNLAIGSTYRFNAIKVFGFVQRNSIAQLHDVRGYMAGVAVPWGLSEIRFSALRTDNTGATADLYALGWTYFFSKRTSVYTTAARLNNSGAARFAMWPALQDIAATARPGAGQDVTGTQVGIRHLF